MVAFYNEIDPKAAAWLRELIACGHIADGVVDERDIRDIRPAELSGFAQCHFFAGIGVWSYALRRAGWPDDRAVWTGSCPCQPFSAAGKGNGFDDERHLWPSFHWLIAQCRPAIVFGEQVASKDAEPWIDLVQDDLETLDYAVGAVPFPSAGVGAPHIRDRLYWVADAGRERGQSVGLDMGSAPGSDEGQARQWERLRPDLGAGGHAHGMVDTIGQRRRLGQSGSEDASDAALAVEAGGLADGAEPGRLARRWDTGQSDGRGPSRLEPGRLRDAGGLADDDRQGRSEQPQSYGGSIAGRETSEPWPDDDRRDNFGVLRAERPLKGTDESPGRPGPTNGLWRDADWLFCRDGKWRPVEPGTFPLAHGAPARVGRLRGYGNAINAEAAIAFIEASGLT